MSDTIIKVEGLGKRYFIGHENQVSYTAMRDVIANNVKGFGKGIQRMFRNDASSSISGEEIEEFWALKDINFEVKKGETLGIIGRNGAGKSTLLKILSRITEQTYGRIEINGRLASLLEVGTGFHPELSGRENIFLNGAILGMSRTEIKTKFDDIVDFSGVEKFLDTPVKRYSSGMYVRLAFAVAAYLESEILIVDEVLAVGDAEFQKKCLGKMSDISNKEGRTVLFVSHNISAIKSLCSKAILLNQGTIAAIGNTSDIINKYITNKQVETDGIVILDPKLEANVTFTKIWINDKEGNPNSDIDVQNEFILGLEFNVLSYTKDTEITIVLSNTSGVNVLFSSLSDDNDKTFIELKPGSYCASISLKGNFLVPDMYTVRISAHYPNKLNIDTRENIFRFNIIETGSKMAIYGSSAKSWCCVMGGAEWNLQYNSLL